MRIGIDARLWNESGVGRYIRNLVFQLQKIDKKNEYVLFVLEKNEEEILKQVEDARKGIQNDNFRIAKADIRWHTIEEQVMFPQILNKENLDLVHFPYFSVPIFYNKPFVVTIHDLILHHFPTGQASTLPPFVYWLKLFGYKFIMQQTAKKAQKIITVSDATKEEIIDHLKVSQRKIVVTYEGVDHKILNKSRSTTYNLQPTTYFLYVGNAYPHKNLERLINAFSTLNSQLSTLKLVLVGREDYFYERLRKKVKKMKLEKQIVFYGYATDEELNSLYKNALALVMPSLMEGFGLPVLEAMTNNCLVLASDIPVHHEIANDAAIYFDPKSIQDIAEKMKLISFNNLNHFSKNIEVGLERTKIFSWQKTAKETLFVYESCVGI